MKNFTLLLFVLSSFLFIQCNSTNLVASDFDAKTENHSRIAILPFDVDFTVNDGNNYGYSESDLAELIAKYSYKIQDITESYLVNQSLAISIQTASITNKKLLDASIDRFEAQSFPVNELAKILAVDAVILGDVSLDQPLSVNEGVALELAQTAERLLSNTRFTSVIKATTNRGIGDLSLHDGQTGDKLWTIRREISCEAGSTVDDVMYSLLKRSTRNIPYKKTY